ncbi:MAG: hypothetical protein K2J15_02970 [Muribaculaceae bacterium]|nr:hypothetical protein [Muribaculaceae bacterium]
MKNAREPILLLVPLSEALELPITVERANMQKPHAEMISISGGLPSCCGNDGNQGTQNRVLIPDNTGHIYIDTYCLLHS